MRVRDGLAALLSIFVALSFTACGGDTPSPTGPYPHPSVPATPLPTPVPEATPPASQTEHLPGVCPTGDLPPRILDVNVAREDQGYRVTYAVVDDDEPVGVCSAVVFRPNDYSVFCGGKGRAESFSNFLSPPLRISVFAWDYSGCQAQPLFFDIR